jgi:hypothetical protein
MSDSAFRPDSDAQWDELMRQLRQQPALPPPPFLYARIRARLVAKANASPLGLPAWLRRPAFVLALGALGLAVSGDGAAATPSSPPGYSVQRVP